MCWALRFENEIARHSRKRLPTVQILHKHFARGVSNSTIDSLALFKFLSPIGRTQLAGFITRSLIGLGGSSFVIRHPLFFVSNRLSSNWLISKTGTTPLRPAQILTIDLLCFNIGQHHLYMYVEKVDAEWTRELSRFHRIGLLY